MTTCLTIACRLSSDPNDSNSAPSPGKLLSRLTARGISIQDVISDRVFTSSEEASEVIRLLSKAAIEANMSPVIAELGRVEAMGTDHLDPLNDVPEVIPVKKLAVSWQLVIGHFPSDRSCHRMHPRRLSMKMATLFAQHR